MSAFDRAVTDRVVAGRTELGETIAHAITVTGNTVVLTVAVVAVTVFLLVRRAYPEAVLVSVGSLLGLFLMVGLKNIFGRSRPPVHDRLIDIDTYSFPSGHAMMSMIVFGLFAVAAYRLSNWVRGHPWVLAIAPLWSIAIGCTRVYLGVHWTTDVLAGWIVGALWVAVCAAVLARVAPLSKPSSLVE
ncbi:phosphatase PAP2 family protein [Gordonia sp. CPCC 205515]|uniref:phosphatase PAP2 family protein n=1 Tax=Gordonia sp. CPCC 205515 TaxID=3140791 RepID=UPI003AF34845